MKSEKTRKRAFFGVAVPGPMKHCQASQAKMTAGPGPAKVDFFVDFSLRLSHTCFLPKKWKNGLFWPVFSTKKWGWARRVDSVSGPRACFFSSVRRGAWKIISIPDFGYFLAYFLVQNWRKIEKLMILLDFWIIHKILPKTCFFQFGSKIGQFRENVVFSHLAEKWRKFGQIRENVVFWHLGEKVSKLCKICEKCRFLHFGQIWRNSAKMAFLGPQN